MRALIAAIAVLLPAPALAADQFDLICSAEKTAERYRIDLAKGEWCFGECKLVMKIQEVTEGTITLFDNKPSLPRRETSYNRIDRRTGDWKWYNYSPQFSVAPMDIKGKCEAAVFSGFNLSQRKF